ncbi:hypothetical protein BpHYR1_018237 [Brachionus plicatilis]|uniref:Uncharacterized protein n=1 Tax=Brachionus plicatilis TaxID=10195 RepID=A0A3M7QW97_BRAPC|nr:hypothetical protein BpHYR1_018237 [Brachionus plicatilis]
MRFFLKRTGGCEIELKRTSQPHKKEKFFSLYSFNENERFAPHQDASGVSLGAPLPVKTGQWFVISAKPVLATISVQISLAFGWLNICYYRFHKKATDRLLFLFKNCKQDKQKF